MLTNSQRFVAALAATFLLGGVIGYLSGSRDPGAAPAVAGRAVGSSAQSTSSQRRPDADREPERSEDRTTALPADADLARHILKAVQARDYFRRRHDIYEFGQRLDQNTIRAAMDAMEKLPEADSDFARYPLLARWLELDQAAAYEWVSALPKKELRTDLMREFFHSLGMKDPAAALGFLSRYKADPNRGEDFTYSVFEAWSAHDPAAAVDAALNLPKKEAQGSGLSVALGRWAKRDPLAALVRVEQMQDSDLRREQRRAVLREWAAADPQAAANRALSLPAGKERNDALASVISGAAPNDPKGALRMMEQMPPGAARTETLRRIVGELGYKEPQAAAEFVLAMPPSQQRQSLHQVIHNLSRQDRAAALEFAGRLAGADARADAVRMIVQQWSSDDPKAAAQYCATNSVGTPETIGSAVSSWARNDATGALAWAGSLPDGPPREAALSGAITALGASDPQRAAALATTMLKGEKQTQALGSIAGAMATKDPAAAAAWAGQLSDSTARMIAASNIALTWAEKDPAAAAAWAVRAPGKGVALSTITREWAGQDPAGAAKWLDTLPSGDTRDSAVGSFAHAVTGTDPEGAAAWAATIAQPSQRDIAISQIFQQWKRTDPKAADTWMRATPALSTEARERMLRSGY